MNSATVAARSSAVLTGTISKKDRSCMRSICTMSEPTDSFFIVTGAPGSGKTTLLAALSQAGHATSIEAGRAIIQDQVAIGGGALPWGDREAFAELMLCWEMRSYREMMGQGGAVFFDRGVPDVAAYLRLC